MVQFHPTAIVNWFPTADETYHAHADETYHAHGAIRAYHVHVLGVDPAPS